MEERRVEELEVRLCVAPSLVPVVPFSRLFVFVNVHVYVTQLRYQVVWWHGPDNRASMSGRHTAVALISLYQRPPAYSELQTSGDRFAQHCTCSVQVAEKG